MNSKNFSQIVENTLDAIEFWLDETELDIEYDREGSILKLEFENGKQIIINPQGATQQLWVAAQSGGFHLDLGADQIWRDDRDQTDLETMLSRLISDQIASPIKFTLSK